MYYVYDLSCCCNSDNYTLSHSVLPILVSVPVIDRGGELEEIFPSDLTVCLFAAGLAVGLDPEGYGNPDFCWISIYDKLIWSFAGPITIVILVPVSLSFVIL